MGRSGWRSIGTRARIAGELEPGTPLYRALHPGRGEEGKRAEKEADALDKHIKVIYDSPRIRIPGNP